MKLASKNEIEKDYIMEGLFIATIKRSSYDHSFMTLVDVYKINENNIGVKYGERHMYVHDITLPILKELKRFDKIMFIGGYTSNKHIFHYIRNIKIIESLNK